MNNYLIPHPPSTVEQMHRAVAGWHAAAAHERSRITHGLCCGSTVTAEHNAALYEATAAGIQREIDARLATPQANLPFFDETTHDQ